jgi:hypothetical protein
MSPEAGFRLKASLLAVELEINSALSELRFCPEGLSEDDLRARMAAAINKLSPLSGQLLAIGRQATEAP